MRVISKENAVFTFNAAHPPKCQIEAEKYSGLKLRMLIVGRSQTRQ